MTEVVLHVYDVTNSASAKTNNTIVQINKIFKDRIGLGGIFHSAVQLRQAKTEIVCASKVAYRFIVGVATSPATPESLSNSNRGSPRFQGTWFKNLISAGPKPSSSSEFPNQAEETLQQHWQQPTT
eukprot:TRINITY_DN3798_c1_g1_i1.p1 TRINITY_DN3798_c1_g1~~TRINITY_DN3798_c1_g1_i1.p1  ORF type:complete len:126 (+),score=17.93 TRINITY_DN3798_c1_g1_i1:158-535(+)